MRDPRGASTAQMTVAAPRPRTLLLHLAIPHLTFAAPNGLRVLAKRGPISDGFIVLTVVLVFILLAVCCFMSMCNLPIDPCGCCRSCSDDNDDDDDDRRRLGGPSSWLFKLSRGRYGAPPTPREPPPPEFELKDVESEPQQWDGYVHAGEPQGHHRRGRSHSQIFREALDVDVRPPAPPEAERAATDRPKQGEAHRDAIDGWRKDVAGRGDQD